jgi:hypothetical protein
MIAVNLANCRHQFSGICPTCRKKLAAMGSDALSSLAQLLLLKAAPGVVQAVGKEISASSDPHEFSAFSEIGDFFAPVTNLFKSGGSTPAPVSIVPKSTTTSATALQASLNKLATDKTFYQKYKTPILITGGVVGIFALIAVIRKMQQ